MSNLKIFKIREENFDVTDLHKNLTNGGGLITHDSTIATIHYQGTSAEWELIDKNKNWSLGENITVFSNKTDFTNFCNKVFKL